MELRKRMRHGDSLVVTIGGERLSITFLDKRAYLKGVAERLPIPESMLAQHA